MKRKKQKLVFKENPLWRKREEIGAEIVRLHAKHARLVAKYRELTATLLKQGREIMGSWKGDA